MYKILRVPNNNDQYEKAYSVMKAYCGEALKISFEDFLKKTKEIYVISDEKYYIGFGYICYKTYTNFEQPSPFNRYGNEVYTLDVITFSDDDMYNKIFDLVNTIIRDCNDRIIMVENIPNENKYLINALRNCRFKRNRKADRDYTQSWYHIPNPLPYDENKLRVINPRDDKEVVDDYEELLKYE